MTQKNDLVEIEITSYSSDGSGIGRHDGSVVFVPFSAVGDRLIVRIIKVTSRYMVGRTEEILQSSSSRIDPVCKYAGKCGGCSFMHISSDEETVAKKKFVDDALLRIGGLDITAERIIAAPTRKNYRNKACYPVALEDGHVVSGFYAPRSHRIVTHDVCYIQSEIAETVRRLTVDFLKKYHIKPYDEKTGTGLVRHIFVRSGKTVCVALILTRDSLPHEGEYIDLLKNSVEGLQSIVININDKNTNAIMGDTYRVIYGDGYMRDALCGLEFMIGAPSFYQVNREQCEVLYKTALDMAQIKPSDCVLDLYCGIGTITLLEARRAKSVVGVEIVPQAIEDAKKNAALNGITNVSFLCADAAEAAKTLQKEAFSSDVITVDPPRSGLDAGLIDTIVLLSPDRLVYISCNPSTLARDAALLDQKGYVPTRCVAADMFPGTKHIESILLFSRRK